ncbi:AfsR/SARP family transcriptional regulator [Amycolatopsis suaedae]|uniref:SARP family transcriptional regulator n=1 Tax=Amycolatopsis suaedae TaxID=2510978 RepID=A0A4Q7J1E8_9PSEU|nr:BTAD domain-containing putative transcriptional regulator [Amycolatopsis suaedae]RZQ60657.1 SARP family transcriptional regulator [Amycolatopsis suaedae]
MLYRVLGPLEVRPPGREQVTRLAGKPAVLLTTLLYHEGEWVDRDQLAGTIWWQATPPTSARSNINSYVWRLRRTLGSRIEAGPGGYRLRTRPGEVDVDRFRGAAHQVPAVDRLRAALELWRGTPYAELPPSVTAPVVAGLDELRRQVRESLAAALTAAGRASEAIPLLRELTLAEPLRESTWARLVDALRHAGRRGEALLAYDEARRLLRSELGVDPGTDLTGAYQQTLRAPAPRCIAAASAVHPPGPGFSARAEGRTP